MSLAQCQNFGNFGNTTGAATATAGTSNNNLKTDAIKIRNWHWTWSLFYFYKKKYNYFYALFKTFSKLLKSFFLIMYFTIISDQNNRTTYLYRFFGLFSAIIGRRSYYRVK